ncbi:hypothetical protein M2447_000739 [Ereboglobus sp. PH5-10]|uniref:hypothetical protein n=1 Tax=Ereboglobus sp. PH5-10 TaxID=2940629 RepID=UPI00240749E7|nr:hypothetical protein [Ereboglobus sp. PH5-10]MDF9826657.1 hypothetical protein [Ereboglobus sp. PH5-10]
MKKYVIIVLLFACGCTQTPKTDKITAVTARDLYSNPLKYNKQYVELSGGINIQFEYQVISYEGEKIKQPALLSGIWISFDIDSIKKHSPQFYELIDNGLNQAMAFKGGLIGNMRCRGDFTVADWYGDLSAKTITETDVFVRGFGHFGAYGALFIVREVLDHQSTVSSLEDSSTPDSRQ